MTIISTFYDAMIAKCVSIWPNAKHIADPLSIETAPTIYLQDGFAVAILPGVGSQVDQSCQLRITRDVLLIRTQLVSATQLDATKMGSSIKTLLESQYSMIAALRTDNMIGGISDISFISDGGIESIVTADQAGRFHVLSSLFTITYIEDLN